MKIHVVQKGETLFSIAQQYGVSARLLQKLNQAPTDGALVPGQTLVVPRCGPLRGSTVYPPGSCTKTTSFFRGRGH